MTDDLKFRTEQYLKKLKDARDDFNDYNYDNMNFKTNKLPITIKHKCGHIFTQIASRHLKGSSCPKCLIRPTKTNEQAVAELIKARGNKYGYHLVNYTHSQKLITIFCYDCNDTFKQKFFNHKNGHNCGNCYKNSQKTWDEFLSDFKLKHGDKYDYSESKLINASTKIKIKCNKCNQIFSQLPTAHASGQGCPHCNPFKKLNTEEFIKKAKTKHGENRYDYSHVDYKNTYAKVIISCNECKHEFKQKPNDHLQKVGCPKCYGTPKKTTEQFVKEMEEKYGNKYSYDLVVYDTNAIKVSMICNECENIFKTTPNHLLQDIGCPYCKKKTELKLANWLDDLEYEYIREHKFPDLGLLRFDFYLEHYYTIIEIDGAQHFKQVSIWTPPELTQANDILKMKYCINNGISVIRLLQEDVYNKDKDYWKPRFKEAMQMIFEKPTIEFIDEKNEYKHLKELMADYKPYDMSNEEIIEELNEVSEKIKQFKITTRNKLKEKARKRIEEQIKESQQ
jgi:very-short-patch-repair endonuclease